MDSKVVLRERADVRPVVGLSHRRVLRHRGGEAQQEIGVGIAGLGAVEREDAVVVEQRVVNDLLVRDIAAQFERVLARGDAEGVLHAEVVASGVRSGDGGLTGEETGHRESRQRRVALNGELRIEVAERCRGSVHARAELAHVGPAELVDRRRAERPGVGEVDVVLVPFEIAVHPRDVAGEGQRLRIRAGQVEVAQGKCLAGRELVIELHRRLVGAQRIRTADFVEAVGQIGQWHVLVLNRLCRRIETRRRDDASGKRLTRHRVVRPARRLGEIARALERRGHHRRVAIVRLFLPQP